MVCWPLRSELSPGLWPGPLLCPKGVLSPEALGGHSPLPCCWRQRRPLWVGLTLFSGGARALPSPVSDFRPGPLGPEMDKGVQGASEDGSVPSSTRAQTASCPTGPPPLCASALGHSGSQMETRGAAVPSWDGAPQPCARGPCTWHLAEAGGTVVGAAQATGPEGPAGHVPCWPASASRCVAHTACSSQHSRDLWVRAGQGLALVAGSVWSDALSPPSPGLGAAPSSCRQRACGPLVSGRKLQLHPCVRTAGPCQLGPRSGIWLPWDLFLLHLVVTAR